ncbi:hypothetical protein [Pseudomonas fluorescens]|uniref:hypothetical protein n=1 Tax=Pseudomonas fluorescens TaxID=294 RepID=UPI00163A84EC|nr:hypothetical protein [Pseudomonas fluorescens]
MDADIDTAKALRLTSSWIFIDFAPRSLHMRLALRVKLPLSLAALAGVIGPRISSPMSTIFCATAFWTSLYLISESLSGLTVISLTFAFRTFK